MPSSVVYFGRAHLGRGPGDRTGNVQSPGVSVSVQTKPDCLHHQNVTILSGGLAAKAVLRENKALQSSSFEFLRDQYKVILNPKERLSIILRGAAQKDFSQSVPLNNYYDHIEKLLTMGREYAAEHHIEKAVCVFLRFCSLLLEDIPEHHEYETYYVSPEERKRLNAAVHEAMGYVFDGKRVLKEVYTRQAASLVKDLCKTDLLHPSCCEAGGSREGEEEEEDDNVVVLSKRMRRSASTDDSGIEKDTMVLPEDIERRFTAASRENSSRGLETFGLLCGIRRRIDDKDIYIATHIILPEQQGFPDHSDVKITEELSSYQASKCPEVLGWIHTHPTGQASMSYSDLHSQYHYQTKHPHAVCILVAPCATEGPSMQYHQLTDHGVRALSQCFSKPEQHTHDTTRGALSKLASIKIVENTGITLHDMRRKAQARKIPQVTTTSSSTTNCAPVATKPRIEAVAAEAAPRAPSVEVVAEVPASSGQPPALPRQSAPIHRPTPTLPPQPQPTMFPAGSSAMPPPGLLPPEMLNVFLDSHRAAPLLSQNPTAAPLLPILAPPSSLGLSDPVRNDLFAHNSLATLPLEHMAQALHANLQSLMAYTRAPELLADRAGGAQQPMFQLPQLPTTMPNLPPLDAPMIAGLPGVMLADQFVYLNQQADGQLGAQPGVSANQENAAGPPQNDAAGQARYYRQN
ncbi:unnamed protein product, partial [Mesorhabditis spiculigera]